MNAYEARKISEEVLFEKLPNYIKKHIQSSADNGEMECNIYKDLCSYDEETILSLQNLGYWVDDVVITDEPYLRISWRDANHFVY